MTLALIFLSFIHLGTNNYSVSKFCIHYFRLHFNLYDTYNNYNKNFAALIINRMLQLVLHDLSYLHDPTKLSYMYFSFFL